MTHLRYYSQFASQSRVNQVLLDPATTADDPRWPLMGWTTAQEYALWAWNTCGVACLRSILATFDQFPSAATLTADLLEVSAYSHDPDTSTVHGLVYAPFVDYLATRWGLRAHLLTGLTMEGLQHHLATGHVVMASVSPAIRDLHPDLPPSAMRRGGHLVLTLGIEREQQMIRFHNPSGYWPDRQANVLLPVSHFAQAFAGRGIAVELPRTTPQPDKKEVQP